MRRMEQRVSLITLGVRDLKNARAFYERLGWKTGAGPDDDVVFFQAGGIVFALWDRARLAEDSTVKDSGGWGGGAPAYQVKSPPGGGGAPGAARPGGAPRRPA